jgi:uncharacterized protein
MSSAEAFTREESPNQAHRASFSFAISCISRYMILRDRAFGLTRSGRRPAGHHERSSRHSISSSASLLDARYVEPASRAPHAAILLCHGIGETVEQWFGVQQLLASEGIASLVFDYSGYGRSTGRPDWEQFEVDAISAFAFLRTLAPGLPPSVLGFSLGTGVAVAALDRIAPHRLVLCAGFTSFRDAATAAWIPRPLTHLVPPIWEAKPQLARCKAPVLVVHGERDTLFPVTMAQGLAGFCSPAAKVVLVPETTHNQPFRTPDLNYWGAVVDWLGT